MKILVTGSAGFIGNHVALKLLEDGHQVIGIDNLNAYYDINLKKNRIKRLLPNNNYKDYNFDITDQKKLNQTVKSQQPDQIIHLAAQAGVRNSLNAPRDYIDANLIGFLNILEVCRNFGTKHLIFASTSSVYGANTKMPFSEFDSTDHPKSLYAATKKTNELMAHSYSHLFKFPVTGLRFFTVYGPWGRPDMAAFIFAESILKGRSINIYNNGNMKRDFTYIDDVVDGIVRNLENIPSINHSWNSDAPDLATSGVASYRIYNIGNNNPTELMKFIEILEDKLGKKAKKNYLPLQPGDVLASWASTEELNQSIGYTPRTSLEDGITKFAEWYKDYFKTEI